MPSTGTSKCARWRIGRPRMQFGAHGWNYDRAIMLSVLDDADALGEALAIDHSLGADPLTRRVARRMRQLELRNPEAFTARQVEVVRLVGDPLSNAEIAERLYVSQRTAERHVAAAIMKLGGPSRGATLRVAPRNWASPARRELRPVLHPQPAQYLSPGQ